MIKLKIKDRQTGKTRRILNKFLKDKAFKKIILSKANISKKARGLGIRNFEKFDEFNLRNINNYTSIYLDDFLYFDEKKLKIFIDEAKANKINVFGYSSLRG